MATQPPAAAPPVAIDDFARALRGSNPFAKNRVCDACDAEVDVPSIHGEEFLRLVRRVEQVRSTSASVGVMVVGAAGVGKSHLLARLARWAGQDGRAAVVFLHNVVASAERMPRYLLRAAVSALAACRGQAHHESELYHLINRAIGAQLRPYGRIRVPSLTLRARTLEHLGREVDPCGDVSRVLVRYLRAAAPEGQGRPGTDAVARHAVDWLAGESIGADAAARLGVRPDGDEALADERVDQVFRALAYLGGIAERPLLLCIDQVDNLDDDVVRALAAFLHGLLDGARHLLVAVSGVKESMNRFADDGVIAQAAWDRLAEYKIELNRIDGRQARALVAARLDRFARPFRGVPELDAGRGGDRLFPLGERWLEDRFRGLVDLRPREVISWSRDRWEDQQAALEQRGCAAWLASWSQPSHLESAATVEAAVDELAWARVTEGVCERQLQPDALPPDADNLAALVASLLERCRGDAHGLLAVERCAGAPRSTYDLIVRQRGPGGAEITTGVLFVTGRERSQMALALRRMLDDPRPPHRRVLVTDDERRPLLLGPRGLEHYVALHAIGPRGFAHCRLDFAGCAVLDALHGFIASARVGDLDVDEPGGKNAPVSEEEAVASLLRTGQLLAHPLLRELIGAETAEAPAIGALLDEQGDEQPLFLQPIARPPVSNPAMPR